MECLFSLPPRWSVCSHYPPASLNTWDRSMRTRSNDMPWQEGH